MLLYTTSTFYHCIPFPQAKRFLRFLDHTAIFLLIACTYTPFNLVSLQGTLGWILFAVVWTHAALDIVLRLVCGRRHRRIALGIYLVMGWVAVFALGPLAEALETGGMVLVLAGGLAYTGGVVFYAWEKRLRFSHAVWHLFVLAGSTLHFLAVFHHVIPPGA